VKHLLVVAVILTACIAHGQADDAAPDQHKKLSVHRLTAGQQTVWQGEQKFFHLLAQKDLKGYMALWDDGFVGWPDYMERPVGKPDIEASVAEEFRTAHAPDLPLPAPTPERMGRFGDVAITTYFWPEASESSPSQYRVLHAWQKGPNGWHIVGGMSCEVPQSRPAGAQSGSPPSSAKSADEAAVEAVVRGYEAAVQEFDYARVNTFLAPDAKWIERSAPEPAAFGPVVTGFWGDAKTTKVRLTNQPHDLEVHIADNLAWVTLFVDVTAIGDSEAARQLLGRTETEETGKPADATRSEWRATYTESEVLTRTPAGWKIVLGHTSRLPEKTN